MSHLLNSRSALVADAIAGELLASNGRLTRLDGDADIRVVLRADWDKSRVAIISGGGAGHEPAHAGFVGQGMLTAAVCGDVFASPSTDAVLAALLAVTGDKGALLIIKNYTGDRLNFGLAAERARAAGLKVETVIVGDDVALPGNAQPRGIAGTLFVHKVAGHAAESGQDLDAVAAAARAAAEATRSIGMALTTCTVPGQEAEARIAAGQAELGLGIHGEPGAEQIAVSAARELVGDMIARLDDGGLSGPLAVLINNLGGLPPVELGVVTEAVLTSPLAARIKLVVGPAALMTSLDMKGFSLSLLPLDEAREAALQAPTQARAWPGAVSPQQPQLVALPKGLGEGLAPAAATDGQDAAAARQLLQAGLTALVDSRDMLNRLDSKVGDGDTGSTVAHAAEIIGSDLDAVIHPAWSDTMMAVAHRAGKAMGGSSGVIASIFLSATSAALAEGAEWPAALRTGLERVSFYGGAKEGDRTMLDALAPAIRALEQGGGMTAAANAAQEGADATAKIVKTSAGRSSYLNARDLEGVADPGAVAVAALFKALAASAHGPASVAA